MSSGGSGTVEFLPVHSQLNKVGWARGLAFSGASISMLQASRWQVSLALQPAVGDWTALCLPECLQVMFYV